MAPWGRHTAGFNTNEISDLRQRTTWRFFVPVRLGMVWAYAALPMLLFGNGNLELLVCVEVRHAIHYSTKTLQNGKVRERGSLGGRDVEVWAGRTLILAYVS